ncbi:MAG: acyl-CoA dehydrogenase, partial [Gammaproteobacteria bacterium]|nr:acyl-CoA dehydrogenase [Gammaproteobacteria bacterium]
MFKKSFLVLRSLAIIIVKGLLRWFRSQQPHLSQHEYELLQSGDHWWEKTLFSGKPNWQSILECSATPLGANEQAFIDNEINQFCALLSDWEINHLENDLPQAAWDFIKTHKLWGLGIAKEFGGLQLSMRAQSMIVARIASRSYSGAITVMVPNALGPAKFISEYGTNAQKQHYLPRLARGEEVSCFALTSVTEASDAAHLSDSGVVCHGEFNGAKVLGIKLNFNKRYITLAPITTLIGLVFQLYDPEHLIGEKNKPGMTIALVPANLPGVEIGARHQPLNLGFMNGPIQGVDVFIPLDYVIGGQECCGQGWQMIMDYLALGRGISLPSVCSGITQTVARNISAYIYLRRQFQRPLAEFEGIGLKTANILALTYLCNAVRHANILALESNLRPAIAATISKYHLTEILRIVVNDAMDIQAGKAVQMGPLNNLADFYSCVPINITVEGANLLTRNLIIFGQGMVRSHPWLSLEMYYASQADSKTAEREFGRALFRHIGSSLAAICRGLFYGLTRGKFIASPKPKPLSYFYQQLTRMSNALLMTTDLALLIYGKKLKEFEAQSARLGDVLSYLYLATSSLKFYNDNEISDDLPLLKWLQHYCLAKIAIAFKQFFANFKPRWLGWLFKKMIFP